MNRKVLMILLRKLRCSDQKLTHGCVVHVDVKDFQKEKFQRSAKNLMFKY